MLLRVAVVLGCLGLLVQTGRAATVEVFGAGGAAGTNGPPFATPGGDGSPATATADGPDATNEAIAHGGSGGPGGSMLPGGGAEGGDGAAAAAHALSVTSDSDAVATSNAIGGSGGGGGGGAGIPNQPAGGVGGVGAPAEATSTAQAQSGAATATALGQGGNGAAGGSFQFDTSRAAIIQGGAPASASAHAEATSETGPATATAHGFAGQALALGDPPAPGQVSNASALANTSGAEDAFAEAEARGNIQVENGASADAEARSALGNATAHARQVAGPSEPTVTRSGPFPTYGGGPGVGSAMQDAVRGSAAGLLTLEQEAIASSAHENYGGGDATSILHAANPGGGALRAEVLAQAGNGGATCVNGPSGPSCDAGVGGVAQAEVGASTASGAPVVARAHAFAGLGGEAYHSGSVSLNLAGNGIARAGAASASTALAAADAQTGVGGIVNAIAEAANSGSSLAALSTLEVGVFGDGSTQTVRSATTAAGVGAAFETAGAPAGGHGELFAAPLASDVSAFLASNPTATAAANAGRVIALGSVGGKAGGDGMSGSLLLDVDPTELVPGETLSIAFLDPISLSGGSLLFDLTLSDASGQWFFSRAYEDTSVPLSELDDAVFALGAAGSLGMSWHLVLDTAADFDLDFALIASSSVPEPSAALLALVALAYSAAISTSRASSARR